MCNCGCRLTKIGEVVSEKLDIDPATLFWTVS
ncbi:IS66 family transposase zinc-finger binding domain-containing protein [Maridesulfovibrio ferrireducens]|nr:IS66 family transposase zinc-finger binding domain-containing protein [Maridesulfovibrio ferrireducens]